MHTTQSASAVSGVCASVHELSRKHGRQVSSRVQEQIPSIDSEIVADQAKNTSNISSIYIGPCLTQELVNAHGVHRDSTLRVLECSNRRCMYL